MGRSTAWRSARTFRGDRQSQATPNGSGETELPKTSRPVSPAGENQSWLSPAEAAPVKVLTSVKPAELPAVPPADDFEEEADKIATDSAREAAKALAETKVEAQAMPAVEDQANNALAMVNHFATENQPAPAPNPVAPAPAHESKAAKNTIAAAEAKGKKEFKKAEAPKKHHKVAKKAEPSVLPAVPAAVVTVNTPGQPVKITVLKTRTTTVASLDHPPTVQAHVAAKPVETNHKAVMQLPETTMDINNEETDAAAPAFASGAPAAAATAPAFASGASAAAAAPSPQDAAYASALAAPTSPEAYASADPDAGKFALPGDSSAAQAADVASINKKADAAVHELEKFKAKLKADIDASLASRHLPSLPVPAWAWGMGSALPGAPTGSAATEFDANAIEVANIVAEVTQEKEQAKTALRLLEKVRRVRKAVDMQKVQDMLEPAISIATRTIRKEDLRKEEANRAKKAAELAAEHAQEEADFEEEAAKRDEEYRKKEAARRAAEMEARQEAAAQQKLQAEEAQKQAARQAVLRKALKAKTAYEHAKAKEDAQEQEQERAQAAETAVQQAQKAAEVAVTEQKSVEDTMQSWVDKAGGEYHAQHTASAQKAPAAAHLSVREALEAIGRARLKKKQEQHQHAVVIVPKVTSELPVIQDDFPEDHAPKMVQPRHTPAAAAPKVPPPRLDPATVEAKEEAQREAKDMATIRRTGLTGLGERMVAKATGEKPRHLPSHVAPVPLAEAAGPIPVPVRPPTMVAEKPAAQKPKMVAPPAQHTAEPVVVTPHWTKMPEKPAAHTVAAPVEKSTGPQPPAVKAAIKAAAKPAVHKAVTVAAPAKMQDMVSTAAENKAAASAKAAETSKTMMSIMANLKESRQEAHASKPPVVTAAPRKVIVGGSGVPVAISEPLVATLPAAAPVQEENPHEALAHAAIKGLLAMSSTPKSEKEIVAETVQHMNRVAARDVARQAQAKAKAHQKGTENDSFEHQKFESDLNALSAHEIQKVEAPPKRVVDAQAPAQQQAQHIPTQEEAILGKIKETWKAAAAATGPQPESVEASSPGPQPDNQVATEEVKVEEVKPAEPAAHKKLDSEQVDDAIQSYKKAHAGKKISLSELTHSALHALPEEKHKSPEAIRKVPDTITAVSLKQERLRQMSQDDQIESVIEDGITQKEEAQARMHQALLAAGQKLEARSEEDDYEPLRGQDLMRATLHEATHKAEKVLDDVMDDDDEDW